MFDWAGCFWFIPDMADEIIDITRYLQREPASELPRGSMALWGADGSRSRFALPLWRIIHLAQAHRGIILSLTFRGDRTPRPWVVLDLGAEPARTDIAAGAIPRYGLDEGPSLLDRERDGLVVYLGSDDGKIWVLLVDGGDTRTGPLPTNVREDILFLSGECAGLLFLRDLARDSDEDEV